MAKKKQADLPSVPTAKAEKPKAKTAKSASINVPLSDVPHDGYLKRNVAVSSLSMEQRINLRRMLRGLEDNGATLKNGKPVNGYSGVLRWFLEQV